MIRFSFLFYLLFFVCPVIAQQKIQVADIRAQYELFEYQKVISLADSVLNHGDTLYSSDIVDIWLLKAQSHYALDQVAEARKCFVELLKIQSDFSPNAEAISPKIISLFNEVKADFEKQKTVIVKRPVQIIEPVHREEIKYKPEHAALYHFAILKSVVLPGWGHLTLEENTKGWVITSAAAVNLTSLVYYVFSTNAKEKRYLNENIPAEIKSKYNEYNSSYKIRNSLIVSFVALWLYAQYDFYYMLQPAPNESAGMSHFSPLQQAGNDFSISLKIPL